MKGKRKTFDFLSCRSVCSFIVKMAHWNESSWELIFISHSFWCEKWENYFHFFCVCFFYYFLQFYFSRLRIHIKTLEIQSSGRWWNTKMREQKKKNWNTYLRWLFHTLKPIKAIATKMPQPEIVLMQTNNDNETVRSTCRTIVRSCGICEIDENIVVYYWIKWERINRYKLHSYLYYVMVKIYVYVCIIVYVYVNRKYISFGFQQIGRRMVDIQMSNE